MSHTTSFEELNQKVFMELLRPYHDGVGKTHAAEPQKDVAHNLAKEAYFITLEYFRTIGELGHVTIADAPASSEAVK